MHLARLALVAALSHPSALAQAVTLDVSSFTQLLNADQTVGWSFVTARNIVVTSLGLWDGGANGFASAHPVRIWTADGSEIIAAEIPAGTAAELSGPTQGPGRFRYVCTSPTLLLAGQVYTIGAHVAGDDCLAGGVNSVTAASGIVWSVGRTNVSGFSFPTSVVAGNKFFGPNFTFEDAEPQRTALELVPNVLTAVPANATIGWLFRPHRDLRVTAVGMWDAGANGFNAAHEVRIWPADNSATLLASRIPAGAAAPLLGPSLGGGRYRYRGVAPITLDAEREYVIGVHTTGDDLLLDNGFTIAPQPDLTWIDSRLDPVGNPSITFPVAPAPFGNAFFAPNFLYEPEPDRPAVEITTRSSPQILNFDATRGWLFSVNEDIVLNSVGLWDRNSDGFLTSHAINVWSEDGSTVVLSARVPAGTAASLRGPQQGPGRFRYHCVPDVLLHAGQKYVIGAHVAGDDFINDGVESIAARPEICWETDRFTSSGFAFPTSSVNTRAYFGPNFTFTPTSRALDLDDGLEFVSVPDAPELVPTQQITVEAWVLWSGAAARPTLVRKDPQPFLESYNLRIEAGRPQWIVAHPSGGSTLVWSSVTMPSGVPTHLAATCDGVTSRLYMNGTEIGSAPASPGLRPSTGELRIGKGDDNGGEELRGQIDEVRLWRIARTESEIRNDMYAKISSALHLVGSWHMDGDLTDATGVHHGSGVASSRFVDEFAPLHCDDSPCYETELGSPLGMADDDLRRVDLPFAFPTPQIGITTTAIEVCSNGYVWLFAGGNRADYDPSVAELVAEGARLCPLWRDFNPQDPLSDDVYVNALPDRVIITWHQCVIYDQIQPYTIQMQLYPDGRFSYFYGPAVDPSNAPAWTQSIVAVWPGAGPGSPIDFSLSIPTTIGIGAHEYFADGSAIDLRNLRIDFQPDDPFGMITTYDLDWACRGLSGMASVSSFGVGCPASAPLSLAPATAGARPILGVTMPLELRAVPPSATAAVLWIGFDSPALALDVINMTGCTYYLTPVAQIPFGLAGDPTPLPFSLPSNLRLIGLQPKLQAYAIASGANPFGVICSDRLELTLGSY